MQSQEGVPKIGPYIRSITYRPRQMDEGEGVLKILKSILRIQKTLKKATKRLLNRLRYNRQRDSERYIHPPRPPALSQPLPKQPSATHEIFRLFVRSWGVQEEAPAAREERHTDLRMPQIVKHARKHQKTQNSKIQCLQ